MLHVEWQNERSEEREVVLIELCNQDPRVFRNSLKDVHHSARHTALTTNILSHGETRRTGTQGGAEDAPVLQARLCAGVVGQEAEGSVIDAQPVAPP